MLNVLERDGYIIRKRAEHDGRLKEITITKATHDSINEMDAYMVNLENMLRNNISEEDLCAFFRVLDQLKENIR